MRDALKKREEEGDDFLTEWLNAGSEDVARYLEPMDAEERVYYRGL